jgi:hypothetical protein
MPKRSFTKSQAFWIRIWIAFIVIGLLLFILGVYPNLIGMDRSPVVGFVQIGTWLFGLALLFFGSYAALRILHGKRPDSLRAEIGERLIATGYVVAAAASLADFIGIGSQRMPNLTFGPIQVIGLVVGIVLSVVGIALYWPAKSQDQEPLPASPPSPDSPAEEGSSSKGAGT